MCPRTLLGSLAAALAAGCLSAGCADAPGLTTPPPPPTSVTITAVSPSSGPLGGGTTVAISGTHLDSVSSVTIGGRTLKMDQVIQGTVLTGITPGATASGGVDVVASVIGGGTATCHGCFTYSSLAGFARYAVTFLGADYDSSWASDINRDGTAVGVVWTGQTRRGRMWPSTGAAVDLDSLYPVDINDAATVLVLLPAGSATRTGLWRNGAVTALAGLDSSSALAGPLGITNGGLVALVGSGNIFLWQSGTVIASIGTFGVLSIGRMNNRGEIAVTGMGQYGYSQAGIMGIGGGRIVSMSAAVALNDADEVIGTCSAHPLPGSSGCASSLGVLPFIPVAINNTPQIVGLGQVWRDTGGGGEELVPEWFVWSGGATAGLTSLVTDSSWQVTDVSAISDRGQIAAYGLNTATGQRGAIRLDPVAGTSGSSAKP